MRGRIVPDAEGMRVDLPGAGQWMSWHRLRRCAACRHMQQCSGERGQCRPAVSRRRCEMRECYTRSSAVPAACARGQHARQARVGFVRTDVDDVLAAARRVFHAQLGGQASTARHCQQCRKDADLLYPRMYPRMASLMSQLQTPDASPITNSWSHSGQLRLACSPSTAALTSTQCRGLTLPTAAYVEPRCHAVWQFVRCGTRCYADGDMVGHIARGMNATILHAAVRLCSAV